MDPGATTPPRSAHRYIDQVVSALGAMTGSDQARLTREITQRLVDDGVTDHRMAVERYGHPIQYAERLRSELGLPPAKPRHRFPKRLIAVLLLAGAVGGAVVLTRRHDGSTVPLSVVVIGETSGDTAIEDGEVVIELHDGTDAEFAVVFTNTGDAPIEVERVLPLSHVELVDGHLEVGGDGSPIVQVRARLAPPGPAALRRAADFDDPLATPFEPTGLAPHEQLSVLLEGTLVDCTLGGGDTVEMRVRFSVTVDGEEQVVDGPMLLFDASACAG
jgi:hypothetical protein